MGICHPRPRARLCSYSEGAGEKTRGRRAPLPLLLSSRLRYRLFTATSCPSPQVLMDSNWHTVVRAGLGPCEPRERKSPNPYEPPNASGPVTFHITGTNCCLGTACTGYQGIVVGARGKPGGGNTLNRQQRRADSTATQCMEAQNASALCSTFRIFKQFT